MPKPVVNAFIHTPTVAVILGNDKYKTLCMLAFIDSFLAGSDLI